jgi:hypothetical protein
MRHSGADDEGTADDLAMVALVDTTHGASDALMVAAAALRHHGTRGHGAAQDVRMLHTIARQLERLGRDLHQRVHDVAAVRGLDTAADHADGGFDRQD